MARQRLRPAQCHLLRARLSSLVVLMECCYAVVCQLQRTSDSTCGSIVCPGEVVQYECRVPDTGSGIVWQLPECLEQDLPIINGVVNNNDKMCLNGTVVIMARGSTNVSSFVSHLDINITRLLKQNLTVTCSFDNGFNTTLIGTDELTSIIAPVPSISRQPSTNVSGIIISLDRQAQLEGCSDLQYNFSEFSIACGSCIPVKNHDNNMITCTNSEVSGCTVTIQMTVCGVVINKITFPIDTSQIITSTSINTDTPANNSDNPPALDSGRIAAIVLAVVVVVVLIPVGLIIAVLAKIYCPCRRKSYTDEEDALNKTVDSVELRGISASNGTCQRSTGNVTEIDNLQAIPQPKESIQKERQDPQDESQTDEYGSTAGTANIRNEGPNGGGILSIFDAGNTSGTGDSSHAGGIHDADGAGDTSEAGDSSHASDTRGTDDTRGAAGNAGSALHTDENDSETLPLPTQDSSLSSSEQVMPLQGGNPLQGSDGRQSLNQPTTSAITETLQIPSSPSPLVGSETGSPGVIPTIRTNRSTETPAFFVSPSGEYPIPVQKVTERPSHSAIGCLPTETRDCGVHETILARLDQISNDNRSFKEQLCKEVKMRTNQVSVLSSQIYSLKEEVTTLRSTIADLQKKLREKEGQHQQELKEEKEKWIKEVQELKQAIATATSQLQQKDITISELQVEIERLKSEKQIQSIEALVKQQQCGDN